MRVNLMLTDIGITAEDYRGIRTNVRILYAEHDLIKEEHILEIGRLIPNAGVRKMDRCNHLYNLRQAGNDRGYYRIPAGRGIGLSRRPSPRSACGPWGRSQ